MNQVNEARRTLTLELVTEGDGLSGRALSDAGAAREFNGRIGLMHAIDELLAETGPETASEPSPQDKRRK